MMRQYLTKKEKALFDRICEGMDAPFEGWLHEMTSEGMQGKRVSGVMSALMKKGAVRCWEDGDIPGCFWVVVAEAWR
jgi:hypothetical protein